MVCFRYIIVNTLHKDDKKDDDDDDDNLENEIKIVKTKSKDINMKCGLEKCARICFKKGRVQSKPYIGNTFAKDIKELDPRIACKYLGIEESHDIGHRNEKEKLKKE